jgi:hypothetical protein
MPKTRSRILAGALGMLVGLGSLASGASNLEWSRDPFEEFSYQPGFGQVARNWTPWFDNAFGEREGNIVPGADKWSIENNAGMRADFLKSLQKDYRWFQGPP